MSDRSSPEQLARRLRAAKSHFRYPATPDLVAHMRATRSRRVPAWRWAALALTILLALALATPPVRAAVLRVWQIGVVRVVVSEPPTTAALAATPSALPENALLRDLAGATTLAAARQQVSFPIRLPAYPPGLGPPDRVFVQDLAGSAVVLVWLDRSEPAKISMSLHLLTSRVMAEKTIFGSYETEILQETVVDGLPALWVRGPHFLQLSTGSPDEYAFRRLVDGNVLIWTAEQLTYRLETDLSLEEAIRIAESLVD